VPQQGIHSQLSRVTIVPFASLEFNDLACHLLETKKVNPAFPADAWRTENEFRINPFAQWMSTPSIAPFLATRGALSAKSNMR
jgi:hypothetical protein